VHPLIRLEGKTGNTHDTRFYSSGNGLAFEAPMAVQHRLYDLSVALVIVAQRRGISFNRSASCGA
jgi:hypothetical protein